MNELGITIGHYGVEGRSEHRHLVGRAKILRFASLCEKRWHVGFLVHFSMCQGKYPDKFLHFEAHKMLSDIDRVHHRKRKMSFPTVSRSG
jgi:hypothetical protein